MGYSEKTLEKNSITLGHGYRVVTKVKDVTYSSGVNKVLFCVDLYQGRYNVVTDRKVLKVNGKTEEKQKVVPGKVTLTV